MAIMRDQPGLKVEILVDGVPLQEYDDDDEEIVPTVVTKYIEAKTGANFTIRYMFLREFRCKHALVADLYIDGKFADGNVLSKKDVRRFPSKEVTGAREEIEGQYFERRFAFSQLNIDDGDVRKAGADLKQALETLGEISLKFRWVRVDGHPEPASGKAESDFREIGTVPEKALKGKALSHQAKLQVRTATRAFNRVTTRNIYGNTIFATYKFKYRSKDALRSLYIIPRTPSPVPLEEREVDQLSPEEMRELLKRQRERDAAAKLVKQEGVKREREQSRDRRETVGGDSDDDEISFISTKRRKLPPSTINEDGVETFDLT